MNVATIVLSIVFPVLATAHWVSIYGTDARFIAVTKALATGALIALAAVAGDMAGDARAVLVVAVVLCLVGDIALLGDSDIRFVAGLGSFAAGHLAFMVTALMVGVSWPQLAIAFAFLAVLFGFRFLSQTVPGARRQGGVGLMGAVIFYATVISAMVIMTTGTSCWVAGAGAMVFAISDWMIGYQRFVKRFPQDKLAVMMTYHLGLALLISGLIASG